MFTGIIEEVGKVGSISRNGSSLVLEINCSFAAELEIGESVAVNGTCLTVTQKTENGFFADATPETFRRTSLSELESGSSVNLERAMKAGGRFGGHIVQGHVDGTGIFLSAAKDENAVDIRVKCGNELGKYIVEKGSVCLDGISLTVASVKYSSSQTEFSVSVIPHTWENTTLCKKSAGSKINIETDIIGKYIEHFMNWKDSSESENPEILEMMTDFKSFH